MRKTTGSVIGAVYFFLFQFFTQLQATDTKLQEHAPSVASENDPLIGRWSWSDSRKIVNAKPAWLGIAPGGKAHIVGRAGSWRKLPGERPKYELNIGVDSYFLVLDTSGKSLEIIAKSGSKVPIKSTRLGGSPEEGSDGGAEKDEAVGAWTWPGAEFLGLHSDRRANIDGQQGSWRKMPSGVPKYELDINIKGYAGGFFLTLDSDGKTMKVIRKNGSDKAFTISRSEERKFLKFIQ